MRVAANGAYVLFGERIHWSGGAPLPGDGWLVQAWVRADQVTDGAFETTLTIPADTLDPEAEYHVATSAAHRLSGTDRTLDAFHDVTIAQPEAPVVEINGAEGTKVKQGDDITFKLSNVDAGAEFEVTIHSDPIVLDELAVADENGIAAAAWTVPTNFQTGDHTVVFADTSSDATYESTFTILAADGSGAGDSGAGSDGAEASGNAAAAGSQNDALATTGGGELQIAALIAVLVIASGAGLMLARRRTAAGH